MPPPGLQLQPFNTIFQLAAHDRAELARARHVVLLPELLVHHLTGTVTAERTSAGCTGLARPRHRRSGRAELAAAAGDPPRPPARDPRRRHRGRRWRGVPVHLVGGHDTASAVVAMGAAADARNRVRLRRHLAAGRSRAARARPLRGGPPGQLHQRAGALGGIRFLTNLAGAWLLEQCRPAWGDPPVEELLAAAADLPPGRPSTSLTPPSSIPRTCSARSPGRRACRPTPAQPW